MDMSLLGSTASASALAPIRPDLWCVRDHRRGHPRAASCARRDLTYHALHKPLVFTLPGKAQRFDSVG
jgi:hypothetical protein